MGRWVKRLLLAALVFGACWGGAIWYWRSGQRAPDATGLVLMLLVLPLALLGVLWLVRRLPALLAGSAGAAAGAAGTSQANPGSAATPAPAPPAPPALAIVAAALRSPHGDGAAGLAKAIDEHSAHPALDPELLDDDGYPQMSARAPLDDGWGDGGALREQVATWLALNGHGGAAWSDGAASSDAAAWSEEQWRTLALAAGVAEELGRAAASHAALRPRATPPGPAAAPLPTLPPLPILQILPLWPAGWDDAHCDAAGAWISHLVAAAGWPAERIVVARGAAQGGGAAPDAAGEAGAHAGEALARLAQHVADGRSPLVAIVLAGASHIGAASVGQWSAEGAIFNARHPQGKIPGEGAAGLLLADPAQALLFGDTPHAHALLHSAGALREASADGARRVEAGTLHALAGRVLADGGASAGQVAMLVADTGHRASRTMELMHFAGAVLPGLDAGDDVVRLGGACASCGEAGYLTALAVAFHHSAEREAPVLCIANEHPLRRGAALILPAAPAASIATSPAISPPSPVTS